MFSESTWLANTDNKAGNGGTMGNRLREARELIASIDVRALVGSACLWSWVDTLYASGFFAPLGSYGAMPELATWLTFLTVVPLSVAFIANINRAARAAGRPPLLLASGAAGTAGSLLLALSAHLSSWPVLAAGAVLAGPFMGTSIFGWGAVYCREGTRSAVLYVAGGFACAIVPDATFLLMAPPAAAIAPAALPLVSNSLLLAVPRERRSYRTDLQTQPAAPARSSGPAGVVRHTLGVSVPTVCSLALVMVGLGYMQHHISFAPPTSLSQIGNATSLQIARGAAAIVLFAVAVLFPRRGSVVYLIGLLAVVAGFSLMPLLYGTGAFWVSGAVILAGYTSFDVLAWVVVAQAVRSGLGSAPRIVCAVQMLVRSLFCGIGGMAGIALGGMARHMAFAYADAIFVGYLITVAIVLLLSARDIWDLFDMRPAVDTAPSAIETQKGRTAALAQAWGLTERETEVFELLAIGRTQPWIAESLGISESTVNSHVRHIYGKSNVRNRQELLDLVVGAAPEAPASRQGIDSA